MILQLGAAVVEHVFIKGTFFVIESTIGWGYWGVSKVYHYYYPIEVNEDDEAANKKYNVSGFPTILLVKGDGETIPFKGPRTAEKIIEFYKSN